MVVGNSPESTFHINVLKMKAILFGLKSFCCKFPNIHTKIRNDNSSAISYITEMGSCESIECNEATIEIWNWLSIEIYN